MSQGQPFIAPPREFSLGGLRYKAPGKIGAGIQADVTQMQFMEFTKTEQYQAMVDVDKIRNEYKTPEAIATKMKALEKEMTGAFLLWRTKNHKAMTLVLLDTILTPMESGYPPMKDVYDQLASSEEVDMVTNFFNGKSNDNTKESDSSSLNSDLLNTAEPSIPNSSGRKKNVRKQKQ